MRSSLLKVFCVPHDYSIASIEMSKTICRYEVQVVTLTLAMYLFGRVYLPLIEPRKSKETHTTTPMYIYIYPDNRASLGPFCFGKYCEITARIIVDV